MDRLEILHWQMTADERRLAAMPRARRTGSPPGRRPDANPGRDGCLETASQRRCPLARIGGPGLARVRCRNRVSDAAGVCHGSVADLWRNPACAGEPQGGHETARRQPRSTISISRPKAPSALPHAAIACARNGSSRRAITRGFRNISRPAPKYRKPSPMRCCAAFTMPAAGVMVSTASIADDLDKHGFQRLMHWSRGVDHRQFTPAKAAAFDLPRPIFLYAGRLAPEKNVEAFLELDLPGSKVVVGDGPSRRALQATYPDAHFIGTQAERRARRPLCLGGCLRVSEPHRYLRHGPHRSARLRSCRWRRCRCRVRSTSSARAAPVFSTWICAPPVLPRSTFHARRPERMRSPSLGRKARASFSTIFCSSNHQPAGVAYPQARVSRLSG